MDFEENVSDFATDFFRGAGRGYGDAGEGVWWWLRDDFGVSWVAFSVECACVDEMTNVVSVISYGPILLGGGECGCSTTYIPVQSVQPKLPQQKEQHRALKLQ